MDDVKRTVLPDRPTSRVLVLSDEAATAEAVRWIGERYVMSEAFARILLHQLARQDGVSEVAAARGLLGTAVVDAATPTALP